MTFHQDSTHPRPIQTVLFDLDGTLRHDDPPVIDLFHDMLEAEGWHVDQDTRREAERWTYEYWARSEDLKADLDRMEDGREELYQLFALRHLAVLGLPQEVRRDLAQRLHLKMRDTYQPVDRVPQDVLPTLEWIRQQGFGLGLVSNRPESLEPIVEALAWDGIFDFTLAAGEVGWWKPDPRLLLHASEMAGVAPSGAIYVGDNPYADVVGAQRAGLQPVLLDPRGLFGEFGCPVIQRISEIRPLIESRSG